MSEFESSQRISRPIWALAAFGAAIVHLGCIAFAHEYLRDDDPDPEFGAPGIEIGVELAAPRLEAVDLPPGPDAEESVASPPVVEQVDLTEPVVLPREVPTETKDPELLVTQVETKKPKEEQPIIPSVMTTPSTETVASKATAEPNSEVVQASTRSVTPAPGTGDSLQHVRATWQKELIAHFDRHKRYPLNRSLDVAEILVNFVIDESGHVLSSNIVRGSGDTSFDEAALAMIARSDPVPRPPAPVVQDGLNFTLPVIFRVKRVN
jgi:periplasmic protein TonB